MSEPKFVDKRVKKNLEREDPSDHRFSEVIKPSSEQVKLTEKWILPHLPEIEKGLMYFRAQADKTIARKIKSDEIGRQGKYPEGFCNEIRGEVFDLINRNLRNKSIPGMQVIENFVRAGGIIQEFWGIDKSVYFQNAIQVGSAIFDVANDTVDPKKPKVVIYPDLRDPDCPIKNIETLEQYAEVVEKYWGYDVYPNYLFPEIAPLYPILAIAKVRDDGTNDTRYLRIMNDTVNGLMWRVIYSGSSDPHLVGGDQYAFGLAYQFLTKSKWKDKRLPKYIVDMLASRPFHRKHIQDPRNPFRISTSKEDVKEIFMPLVFGPGGDGKLDTKRIMNTA